MTNKCFFKSQPLLNSGRYALLVIFVVNLISVSWAQNSPIDPIVEGEALSEEVAPKSKLLEDLNDSLPVDTSEALVSTAVTSDLLTEEGLAPEQDSEIASLPHNLSPWGMFVAADKVVKAVMIILAIASLLTWTALVSKTLELNALKRRLRNNLNKITKAHALSDMTNVKDIQGVGRALINASVTELTLSAKLLKIEQGGDVKDGIKERVASSLSRIEATSARRMLFGTGLLATIGSTAPFVGLLGTVWGIMNSFIGISQANTTNLAVVAPGIAEALLATALGLVAAIPAVVIYNHFTRQIAGAKSLVSDTSAAVMRLVSRDLDRGVLLPSNKK